MKNVNSNNKYFDPVLVFQASDSTTISTLYKQLVRIPEFRLKII